MYRILKCNKDTYIHNRVINNKRTEDSNVGSAATLDLFYLFDESDISNSTGSVEELSRLLVKFDLDPLRALTGTILDYSASSFKAILKLVDVYGGQTTPSNFNVSVFAMSKSWNEGVGRDIASYRDLDVANFLTASVVGQTPSLWAVSGANHPSQDYLSSTVKTQSFTLGTENLEIDITSIVSGTLAGIYPDEGFRISFSGSHEIDQRTKFVKRFGARHATSPSIRPQLIVKFDDAMQDDVGNFYFDLTGSLFMYNLHFGQLANITGITGSNSFLVEIVSGTNTNTFLSGTLTLSQSVSGTNTHRILSGTIVDLSGNLFRKFITGSQYRIGNNFITGTYFATFAISAAETGSLLTEVRNAGSATFKTIWRNFAGTEAYRTGSLVIKEIPRVDALKTDINLIRITNNNGSYKSDEVVKFRVFAQSHITKQISAKKLPFFRGSEIIKNMYYQIVDANNSKKVIIPFDTTYTKVSTDSEGMYFNIYMTDLAPGLTYGIELKFEYMGAAQVYDISKLGAVFTIIP